MKSIYILLTRSETYISRMIGLLTADAYTHASIAFTPDLEPLYSFARKHTLPLPAGFRVEGLDKGYYKKYGHIPCAVYELQVSDDAYEAAQQQVEQMMQDASMYRYNFMGLLLCKLNIVHHRKRHYFCSEFVSEVLQQSNALDLPKDPSLMRPVDFMELDELSCRYEGNVRTLSHSRCISA